MAIIRGPNNRKTSPTISKKGAFQNIGNTNINQDYVDLQFQRPPPRIPKKSIFLAFFLFVFGTSLLALSFTSLIRGDSSSNEEIFKDRILPMLVIGTLMFIPGFYHVRIAYFAYMGVAGFNFDDIPEFE